MTSTPTSPSAAAPSPSPVSAWLGNRWAQGLAAGALTLVPVRRYPKWLRQAAMWVPAAGAAAALVTPRVWELMAEAGARRRDEADQPLEQKDGQQEQTRGEEELSDAQRPPHSVPRPAVRWGLGLAVGASVYGYMRFALWLDGATEDKLREIGVAHPRATMAVLGGLFTAATGKPPSDHERSPARRIRLMNLPHPSSF